jgi:folate-binding protein YgfZ
MSRRQRFTAMTSDFERALRARGAVLDDVHGLKLPVHFGDPGREWRAAREGGAVYAAGFRALITASGDDRVTFLQGMLSNDVKRLTTGQGVYAAFLTQQGRLVSDMRVYAEADRLLLDVPAWRRALFEDAISRFIVADDVELTTADEQPLVGLEGPLARAMVGETLGTTDLPQTPYSHQRLVFEGAPLLVISVSEVEGSGLLLCGATETAPALFDACVEAGAQPLGMRALDVLRVEAGVAWPGVDTDDSTLIMETGRQAAISFTKGCYLGQEVVERVSARGHVNRHVTGLIFDGDVLPASGALVLADGQEVGYVTSAVRSEARRQTIALAMIQQKHATPGERVAVDTGGASTPATVSGLPFAPGNGD